MPASGITKVLLAQVGDLSVYGECIANAGSVLSVASTAAGTATWFHVESAAGDLVTTGNAALTTFPTPVAAAGLLQGPKNGQLIHRAAGRTATLSFYVPGDGGGCVFAGTGVNAPA